VVAIHRRPDLVERLSALSRDAQYDLACACGSGPDDRRRRSADDTWLYPASLPNGGRTVLFRTLLSNACVNGCGYCPVRADADVRRVGLEPAEVARVFDELRRRGLAAGVFLSSAVSGGPDRAMERLIRTARLIRRNGAFRGYLHLKIIPGASDAAVREALSLASSVSVNIEIPDRTNFDLVCDGKDFERDVIGTIRRIRRLTAPGAPFAKVRPTTQFVVGASRESDAQILDAVDRLYRVYGIRRAYFSAYQRGLGRPDLPGESDGRSNADRLMREHRLYQSDFLIRRYGFRREEIPLEADGNLSLRADPKAVWAARHPEFFPVRANRAGRAELLRVPGLGPVTVERMLAGRREGRLRSLAPFMPPGRRRAAAASYLVFD